MTSKFTQKAQNVLNSALTAAKAMGHTYVGSEHLLIGLACERDSVAAKMLMSKGAMPERIRGNVADMMGKGTDCDVGAGDMTPCVKRIIEESGALSVQYGQSYIGTEHLLLALLGEKEASGVRLLDGMGVSVNELKNDISVFLGGVGERTKNASKPSKNDAKQLSALSGFGKDLTAAAKLGKLDPIIGRQTETARVIQILSRRTKNNPCLIGEPGVGKTAVVEGLAQRIADGNVPFELRDKLIITLDIPSMIAGAKYRGEFEERLKGVMNEVAKRPEIILFADELHTIVGAGAAEGAVDAANIIKPALSRGELQMIGATTLDEYRRHIEKDAALERRFQPVTVAEPTPDEAKEVLFGLRDRFEAHHRLKISDEAIRSAVDLSVRYINDRFLPDKALDLIDETAARLRVSCSYEPKYVRTAAEKLTDVERDKEEAVISQDFERAAELRDREISLRDEYEKSRKEWQNGENGMTVKASDIAETVALWTGVPLGDLQSGEKTGLLGIEEKLKAKIIGQDKAAEEIAKAVRRGRTGINDPQRPQGSFMFSGPSGVGKTALAKALAEAVYGKKTSLIRLDMSEFTEKHSVSKLIGSPPGYIGYDEGGGLTEKVRRDPYSLILFDELEKAHPDVFGLLLQILDDGRLTDAKGKTCDFRNTLIIMTTNIGAGGDRTGALGFTTKIEDEESEKERTALALRSVFRPELLNRIDEVIVFRPLSHEDLIKIAELELASFAERIRAQGIELTADRTAAQLIVSACDEKHGARPIRRTVSKLIGDAFSTALLEEKIKSGDRITATAVDGNIRFIATPCK